MSNPYQSMAEPTQPNIAIRKVTLRMLEGGVDVSGILTLITRRYS